MLYTFYILYAYKQYYYIVYYYYYIMQKEDLTFSTKISAPNLIYLHIFLCTYKNFHVETDHFWVIFGNSKLIHLIGLNCFIRWIKFANSYWLFLRFCTCKFLDKEGPWNLSSGNFNGQIRMLKSLWCCLMSCHKQSIGYMSCIFNILLTPASETTQWAEMTNDWRLCEKTSIYTFLKSSVNPAFEIRPGLEATQS